MINMRYDAEISYMIHVDVIALICKVTKKGVEIEYFCFFLYLCTEKIAFIMKKVCVIGLFAIIFAACQESLEDRCAREAKEYTRKNCPSKIEKNIIIDSLTFDRETHTLHYYYTLTGVADREDINEKINGRQVVMDVLKNSTAMKVYKENHYNFTYTYRSEKDPSKILIEVTLTDKDY